ncbi:hypothetical protein N7533_013728 [Penicillium manginii]|uniref:uncharacterized protein n=1 Tax=Penicillium manginii TaxID=203109 RepID=UPI002547D7CF|nr:uncharacterized protein N7533_013728 [Penicillium manginii]KAJ5733281.1 hypothetical protein N7533_013728 [Penicillium manginii]
MMPLKATLVTCLATAANSLVFTNRNFDDIVPGKAFNITWEQAEGPVSLTLFQGATAIDTYFKNAGTIASDITDRFYVWTPKSSLTRDVYTIRIEDSTNSPIYSFQFGILTPIVATTSTLTSTATSYASTVWAYPTYLGCDGVCPSVI